jgi:hypothetical protein
MTQPELLSADLAASLARIALTHVEREYPNKLDHVIDGPDDVRAPSALHPVFFGSFDWHSCVHGYWLLATVARRYPDLPEAMKIRELFDRQLTIDKIADEIAYLDEPLRAGFERPYGWAWLLMLSAELGRGGTSAAKWHEAVNPLAEAFVKRFKDFLPKLTYPIRVGTHFNTAFALALAMEYADARADGAFGAFLREHAMRCYAKDVDCQAWEPGGDDFLSSALMEAECMRNVLSAADFDRWLGRFLPHLAKREPATLFRPATVSDRSDGKIAHLDGLNLSRAWCWRLLAGSMAFGDARREIALDAAKTHLHASLPHVAGDYAGEHWLATFAVLAVR